MLMLFLALTAMVHHHSSEMHRRSDVLLCCEQSLESDETVSSAGLNKSNTDVVSKCMAATVVANAQHISSLLLAEVLCKVGIVQKDWRLR